MKIARKFTISVVNGDPGSPVLFRCKIPSSLTMLQYVEANKDGSLVDQAECYIELLAQQLVSVKGVKDDSGEPDALPASEDDRKEWLSYLPFSVLQGVAMEVLRQRVPSKEDLEKYTITVA